MSVIRGLLQPGNSKFGSSISVWNVPAVTTCPGRSSVCESVCYANDRGRFRFESVKQRIRWNWEQAQRDDFVDRMVLEIGKKGCQVIRVHGSGDFSDKAYAEKWLAIMKRKPKPRYFWYSRSWRDPEIAPVLEQMAQLKQCRAWYSVDRETGVPDRIPPGVRLAYLQTQEGEEPERLDLRFNVRRLRKLSLPLSCPQEQKKAASCGDCSRCFR